MCGEIVGHDGLGINCRMPILVKIEKKTLRQCCNRFGHYEYIMLKERYFRWIKTNPKFVQADVACTRLNLIRSDRWAMSSDVTVER